MSKILFSGDPHGRMSTLDTFKAYLAFMLKVQDEHQHLFTIVAGDLFNDHANIRSEVMNQWLKYLRETNSHHILMKGNHDETAPGSGVHALTVFEEMDQHKVVGNDVYIMPEVGKYNGAFIPYVQTVEDFQKLVTKIREGIDPANTVLFTHQSWDGAVYENGMYAPDGFPVHLVQDFKLVVSGHIHKEQNFANIIYPGTPYSQGFVDADQNKSLWVIDMDRLEFTRIPTPMPRYFVKELNTSDFIQWFESKQSREGRRHHYKVVLRDSKASIRALRDSSEFKKIRKQFKLMLSPEYVDAVREERISDSVSPEKMMEKYVYEIMNTKLNRTELFKIANKFMRGE